jgi:hypothetical protein
MEHVLRLAIFHFSGNILVVDNRGGFFVFIEHGGVLDRRLRMVSPVVALALAFGLLLSDRCDVLTEQPQAQRAEG